MRKLEKQSHKKIIDKHLKKTGKNLSEDKKNAICILNLKLRHFTISREK